MGQQAPENISFSRIERVGAAMIFCFLAAALAPMTIDYVEERRVERATADAARILLENGAHSNARDDQNGATALHWAAWNGEREHIDVLLAHGADPTLQDRTHSGTPSGWANANGHKDLAELLR